MSSNENRDSESSMGEFSAQGYQYEPEFIEEELESIVNQPQNAMTELERIFDFTWLNCRECMIMPSRRESICCQEFEHYMAEYLSQSATCITRHQDFELVCLNSAVPEKAYVGFLRFKHQCGRTPDFLFP